MSALVWLLLAVALCAGELVTLNLVLLMLGAAALVGAAVALADGSLALQAAAAAASAAALLVLARPALRRRLEVPALTTGEDRLAGCTALVVEPVTATGGQVRINGELWRARPWSGGPDVPAGHPVVVASVVGATLYVYPEEP